MKEPKPPRIEKFEALCARVDRGRAIIKEMRDLNAGRLVIIDEDGHPDKCEISKTEMREIIELLLRNRREELKRIRIETADM